MSSRVAFNHLSVAGASVRAAGKSPVLLVGTFLSAALNHRSVCEELAARLSDAGWPVLTTSEEPGRLARLCDVVATAWRRRLDYQIAQVDVFSGPAFVWAEAACGALWLAGKPFVLTLHGGNLPNFARRWPRRVRRLLNSAAAVTTPSRYLLEEMSRHRRDLLLLPNPLDVQRYAFRARRHPEARLVWLRAFRDIYHPELAVETLALLATDFPEARLNMIGHDKGDGSRQRTERAASESGVAERLLLPGGVPKAEVPGQLALGDIFLNTTNVDNTPVSVLEAMACGLCVVSTNVGGIPYLLEHEHDALLVPPGDAQAMAAAVRRLLTEPELAERLSRNGRRKAEQFDWSSILPRWESLLTAVADGRPTPSPAK
ncbi:MAG: glycosyltransferase family 4 protein [Pyrinomonadaceae bacterium]